MEKLPKKWCIAVTKENIVVLGKWRSSGPYGRMHPDEPNHTGYCHSDTGLWEMEKLIDYTEISFEDFKRLVLKENTENYEIY